MSLPVDKTRATILGNTSYAPFPVESNSVY